jgi:tRNA G18 (ribose-2'-O)-methylase SpoU
MPLLRVSSASDPRLADYVGLRDRDLLRRDEGLFVGEQLLIVQRMLSLPGVTRSVLCAENFQPRVEPRVPADIPLYVAPMELLERVAGFPVHRGVLAIGVRSAIHAPSLAELAAPLGERRVLLACEEITHADNMGALFRVAAGLGAGGILLSPTCHDPLYRRCLRVSVGLALSLPWRRATDWPGELLALRHEAGFACLGAAVRPGAPAHDTLTPPARLVLLLGTEFAGLSSAALACCDGLVRIPMERGVDSLNVAVAAGILLDRLGRR